MFYMKRETLNSLVLDAVPYLSVKRHNADDIYAQLLHLFPSDFMLLHVLLAAFSPLLFFAPDDLFQ